MIYIPLKSLGNGTVIASELKFKGSFRLDTAVCVFRSGQLRFHTQIGNFLSLHWHSPLQKSRQVHLAWMSLKSLICYKTLTILVHSAGSDVSIGLGTKIQIKLPTTNSHVFQQLTWILPTLDSFPDASSSNGQWTIRSWLETGWRRIRWRWNPLSSERWTAPGTSVANLINILRS